MKICLTLLVYNEIEGLKSLFDQIPVNAVDEILAVDGGSQDGSIEFLRSRGVRVVVQTKKGRGEAFHVAFASTQADAIIFFSPDGNESIQDIPRFRPYLKQGFNMVIANRMSNGGHNEEDDQFLKFRKMANQLFTLIANFVWNRRPYIFDTINGFRAITRSSWYQLGVDHPTYGVEYQSSIRSMKLNFYVAEFPTYEGQRIDTKHAGSPSLSTGLSFVKLFFREILVGRHWNVVEPAQSETFLSQESLKSATNR